MSEIGKITISVEKDDETQDVNVSFSASKLSLPEMNYWLDYVKAMVISGQANPVEE